MNLIDARRIFGELMVMRVATLLPDGSAHLVPLWFVWREDAIYVSVRRSATTFRNAERDSRTTLLLDIGRAWSELAGVIVHGRSDPLAGDHPALRRVISEWHEKYRRLLAGEEFQRYAEAVEDPGMLRVKVERLVSFDHIPQRLSTT